MKLIILSSGTGRRLMPLTANTPKSLIDLGNGKTLLETVLNNVKDSKAIDEVVIVIGYCADQVEAKIKKYKNDGMKITTIYNPFYEVSNNLMTLWMAKHEMNDDFMITNGDNILQPEVFAGIAKHKNGVFLTTSKRESYRTDDMKVIIEDGAIEQVSKSIANEKADAESVGLTLISGEKYRQTFKQNLEELARDPAYINKFWLEVFNRMINKGVRIIPFEIDGAKMWVEIDFHGDLNEVIRKLIASKLQRLPKDKEERLAKRLQALETPRMTEEQISKVIDFLPEKAADVEYLFTERKLTSMESQAILDLVKAEIQ